MPADHGGDDHVRDAFATDNLWKPSSLFHDPAVYDSSLFAPIQLDVSAIKLDHPYAPKHGLERELQLPDLETFEFGALPELESLETSSCSADAPLLQDDDCDDIWKIALEPRPADEHVNIFSWESFENRTSTEHRSPYVTEAGPDALDAALAKDDESGAAKRITKGPILLESLWNLGLGRSSKLFNWDAKARSFVPVLPTGLASGMTPSSFRSLANRFIVTGNTFLYLRSFAERTFASPASLPARVALATSVSSILSTFEEHLGRHANSVKSLLQLQQLFDRPREILVHIARIVDAMKYAKSNEQLASLLHQRVLEIEGDDLLRRLSSAILLRVSKPSMELIGEWIGIQKGQEAVPIENRGSFITIEDTDEHVPTEYTYNPEAMPRFVTVEDGNMIFETGKSLRFIRSHHPDHPLASLEKHGVEAPELEWRFGWEDIQHISSKAQAYENALRAALRDAASTSAGAARPMSRKRGEAEPSEVPGEDDFAHHLNVSAKLFDAPPDGRLPDELQLLTSEVLNSSTMSAHQSFSPPTSLTWTLSVRPLLSAQARLVNAASLRLFFRSHQLRTHLSLQRQYHLLGDGVFSSRLASALFDPDRETAERQKGTMRSGVHMGLQVGSRSTWPPASSELRLALMGVLSESFYSSAFYHSNVAESTVPDSDSQARKAAGELPGQLNFAVRHLSEPEMEKVMDPDSLYALDFLRLQYVPPSPLHLVITARSLERYDYIFRFLLRLLRILFVISRLPHAYPRPEHRYFRMEATHFVTCLAAYMFQTGIAEHWDAFESFISTTENQLSDEDATGDPGAQVRFGLDSLRNAHEQCLDSILFSLLLRRRQKRVMSLLEEIFEHILLFAKIVRDDEKGAQHAQVGDLYARLKGKIRVFISVVKGLTGKRGYGKSKGAAEENTLERLGLLLEMNGYYGG